MGLGPELRVTMVGHNLSPYKNFFQLRDARYGDALESRLTKSRYEPASLVLNFSL